MASTSSRLDAVPSSYGRPRLVPARRMRICHIVSADLWAGAEVQVATVASYLAGRPDVELSAVLLNEGALARELRRMGVAVTVIDEQHTSALGILFSLIRHLRSHPVDLVHTHRYKETVLGALAARLSGIPRVVRTVHGGSEPMRGWPWAKFRAYEALDRLSLTCLADRIIAVSTAMARGLVQSGHRPETVVTLHNGVDLGKVRPGRPRLDLRRELGIAPGTTLIGTVGRLSPVKGHAHLLRAASRMVGCSGPVKFLIVGDGPLREELALTAAQLGIADACAFVGARADVHDLTAAMDVFVLPSLDEGLPMALLEAMALGVPVVASAVGGIPDVVEHRASGLLVPPRDEAALAEACLELARDPGWAEALGARGRRVVEERFSREHNGEALMTLYRGVLDPLPAPGLLARGVRTLVTTAAHSAERRRVDGVRRDPTLLVAALRSARRILIVCQGNIIRSPFAARLLARELGDAGGVAISSAGFAARSGTPSPPPALLAAERLRVDLRDHAARLLTPQKVAGSDVIFVMDVAQVRLMRQRFPEAQSKVFLLTSLAPESPLEVRDPFDGDESCFQTCYEHISASVRPLVRLLSEGAPLQ